MAPGRRGSRDSDDDAGPSTSGPRSIGQQVEHIGNKIVRSVKFRALKRKEDKRKKAERKKRQEETQKAIDEGRELPVRQEPKASLMMGTIENQRVKDETMVAPDDEEVAAEEEVDEFAAHFSRERPPNVLITTNYHATAVMYKFIAELMEVFPNATFYKRQGFPLKKIVEYATNREFTDIVVLNEDSKKINGMLVTHLPDGPTARFRVSSVRLGSRIKGAGRATSHRPEVVLNNFGTRLGHRVGRVLASLFHQDPAFRGRRVVTFHNQRDYIFFRHHRYVFEEKEVDAGAKKGAPPAPQVKARLQEIGPRFTLRLESLQKGTFDSKYGEFEWVNDSKQDAARRKFKL